MGRPSTYLLDHSYFKNIDTKNKAYVLGFIYADGSINKYNLSFSLSYNDIEILEFIKKELKYNGYINKYKINNRLYCRLSINSKILINDLIKLGIIYNKTYLCNKLPNYGNYFGDFLRGFFDGDGSIYKNKNKKSIDYVFNLSNNYNVLNEIKERLLEYKISSNKIRFRYTSDNIYSCMLDVRGSFNIEKIYKLIYNDGFCLKRKHGRFLEFFENLKLLERRKLDETIIKNIKKLYINGEKQFEIAKFLNIPPSTIRGVIQRLRKQKLVI